MIFGGPKPTFRPVRFAPPPNTPTQAADPFHSICPRVHRPFSPVNHSRTAASGYGGKSPEYRIFVSESRRVFPADAQPKQFRDQTKAALPSPGTDDGLPSDRHPYWYCPEARMISTMTCVAPGPPGAMLASAAAGIFDPSWKKSSPPIPRPAPSPAHFYTTRASLNNTNADINSTRKNGLLSRSRIIKHNTLMMKWLNH